MHKIIRSLLITFSLLVLLQSSTLAATKIITLKDGSVLKGNIVKMMDGQYTLATENLGEIKVPESDVLSIQSLEAISSSQQLSNKGTSGTSPLKNEVERLQGDILADPNLMNEVQTMIKDEEIKSLLSDPKLLDDVMSFDQDTIQNNKNIQQLLQNPKMKNLMNKIQEKIPAQ